MDLKKGTSHWLVFFHKIEGTCFRCVVPLLDTGFLNTINTYKLMFFIHCSMHSAYQRGHCYHCLASESCISSDIILPSMPVKYSNVPNAVERMPLLSRDISFFSDTMEGHRWTTLVAGSICYLLLVTKPCCFSQLGNITHSWEPTSYPQQSLYGMTV